MLPVFVLHSSTLSIKILIGAVLEIQTGVFVPLFFFFKLPNFRKYDWREKLYTNYLKLIILQGQQRLSDGSF